MKPQNRKPISRSENMRRIGSRDTEPELRVRRELHARGWRYLVCPPDLPGRPDLLFRREKLVVQINGCFWHQHPCCPRAVMPISRPEYWRGKLARNVERDRAVNDSLRRRGFGVITIWECDIKRNLALVIQEIENKLKRGRSRKTKTVRPSSLSGSAIKGKCVVPVGKANERHPKRIS
jgi:DNA mismatch endonuclease, patch repair protein